MRMITSSLNNQQNRKFLKLMLEQKLLQSVATCNKRTRTEMTSMNRNCLGLFLDFWSTRLFWNSLPQALYDSQVLRLAN